MKTVQITPSDDTKTTSPVREQARAVSSSEVIDQTNKHSSHPKVDRAQTKGLYIKTWGCQMNVYDTKRMADVLRPLGYQLTDAPDDADFIILNTCHIREKATEKVFSELGRLKPHKMRREKEGKQTLMAVAGCVAQAEGDVITTRATYVDLVFGPQAYHELPEMVAQLTGAYGEKRVINTDFPPESKFDFLPQEETIASPPVAHVAIQEGCDKFCTFCVVPYTRGAEYSRSGPQILAEIKNLVQAGAKEIQLLGQNVNAWHGAGPDGSTWNLGRLIFETAEIEGVERIRYTTSHPMDMHDDLFAAHRDVKKLMPYLHLPIQSGSNTILKAMNRKHTRDDYLRYIDVMREARPDIAFSTDIIVGFPGETDQDFADTMDIIERVQYGSAYTFKYSMRPGTPASSMQNQVHESVKDFRLQVLQKRITFYQEAFNKQCLDRVVPVLFERAGNKDGQIMGRSPHLQSVYVTAPDRLIGQIIDVRVTGGYAASLSGEVVTF
jgi:tRNA-2-methylthio-N6-dimethylallyladenosine synthase